MNSENNAPFGIDTQEALFGKFLAHCNVQLSPLKLRPLLSQQRILEILCAWKEDLDRSKRGSFRSELISPDHIKSAAHLTYWIRRCAPIIGIDSIGGGMYSELETLTIELDIEIKDLKNYSEISQKEAQEIKLSGGMPLAEFIANRERAFAYGNELFAFTFGFNLAKTYEVQKQKELERDIEIKYPDGAYIEDLCYFLKFKSVSPHSIDLIYRALLKNLA
jgi:hypothetical protein